MRDPQDTKYVWDEKNFKIIKDSLSAKPAPEPDFATVLQFESMQNRIEELTKLLRDTERVLDEAREQNSKLRDIAERAQTICERWVSPQYADAGTVKQLRAALDQFKEITE